MSIYRKSRGCKWAVEIGEGEYLGRSRYMFNGPEIFRLRRDAVAAAEAMKSDYPKARPVEVDVILRVKSKR